MARLDSHQRLVLYAEVRLALKRGITQEEALRYLQVIPEDSKRARKLRERVRSAMG